MMTRSRSLLTLALGLAAVAFHAPAAKADPITYSTIGTVGTPTGGIPNFVYFNGMSNNTLDATAGINLGQFQVSSLAATQSQTYANTPFQIIVSSGSDSSEQITGTLNGPVGNGSTAPFTATITGLNQFGNDPLPFTINLPLNTPMSLNTTLPGNSQPASTSIISAVTVPEPASALVFAVAAGGLGLFARNRRRASAV